MRLPLNIAVCFCLLWTMFGSPARAQSSAMPAVELPAMTSLSLAAQSTSADARLLDNPFAAGSWTFQTYGSATLGDDAGELYLAHAGVGYALCDGLTLNLEGVGGYATVDDDVASLSNSHDAVVSGFDLLLRWHVINEPTWSIYLDGGAGMIYSSVSIPAQGTNFNFTPQAGVGMTVQLGESARLMGGARWHHISNAGKDNTDDNPGFDGVLLYAGVMIPF